MYTVTEEGPEHLTRNCEVSGFHCFQLHHQPWFLPTFLAPANRPELHLHCCDCKRLLPTFVSAKRYLCPRLETESFCQVYQHGRFDSSGSSALLTALNCQFLNENFHSQLYSNKSSVEKLLKHSTQLERKTEHCSMQNAQICKDSINANRLETPFATLAGIIDAQLKAKGDNIPQ